MTAVLAKVTFNYPQALKTRTNGHDKDLDILDRNLQNFLTTEWQATQNDNAIQQLSFSSQDVDKTFTAHKHILINNIGFYDK